MKHYPLIHSRKDSILFGVFLFALLYITRNTMTASALIGIQTAQFLTLGLMALLGIGFLIRYRKEWKAIFTDGRIALLAVCTVVCLLPMLLKRDWQMMYISVLLCMYYAIFFTYFISLQDLARYYVMILAVVGAYSIFTAYVLRILPDHDIIPKPIMYNAIDYRFYYFGTYVPLNYVKTRNFGLFREPGVYQYFLTLALFLNNYVANWDSQKKLWILNGILAVTLLTTMATGGVAGLCLFAVVLFFEKKLYRNKRAMALVILLLLLLVLAVAVIVEQQGELYWELYSMVIGKFTNSEAESASDRVIAIMSDLKHFLQSPLTGAGIAEVLHAVDNNTTSTMLMLAMFGIGGGALHIGSWFALVWSKNRKIWVNLGMIVITFLSFNTQNLIADTFFWLFPLMALTEWVLPKLQKKE